MPYYLFIDPLPASLTSGDFAALLEASGEVVSTSIACDSLGYSLRFVRAEMQTEEGVNNAVKHPHGKIFHGVTLTVLRTEECELAPYQLPGTRLAS